MRISFFGGGTDYENFFQFHSGSVLGCAIQSYVYIAALSLPPTADEKYRFTYRISESVQNIQQIKHPVVRETLNKLNWDRPLNIATMADLPGNSGLGSSSAFTVALLKLLYAIRNVVKSPYEIAIEAIEIERKILKEDGGWQDQFFSSFGGLRKFDFGKNSEVTTESLDMDYAKFLESHLMLFPIGGERNSSKFASQFIGGLGQSATQNRLKEMTKQSQDVFTFLEEENLSEEERLNKFCSELNLSWQLKFEVNSAGEMKAAYELINGAKKAGALAGKLCGAGGSGYIVLLVPSASKVSIASEMGVEHWFEPKIAMNGAEIFRAGHEPSLGNFWN